MDLAGFKEKVIREKFEITEDFGKIYSFIDFGNVDYWYEDDIRDKDSSILSENKKLVINLDGISSFIGAFSEQKRFYYGHDPENKKSMGFLFIAKRHFNNVITKPIQKIKHYLDKQELTTRQLNHDSRGKYIYIPKCNFDVEMCIDAIRLIDRYDTFCLFSSDADFVSLLRYLKDKNKKVVLVRGGFVQRELKNLADIDINAQEIKQYISYVKQKSSQND